MLRQTEEVNLTLLIPWPIVLMNSGYWMTRTSDLDGVGGALVTGLKLDRSKLGLLRPKPGSPRLDRLGNKLGGWPMKMPLFVTPESTVPCVPVNPPRGLLSPGSEGRRTPDP